MAIRFSWLRLTLVAVGVFALGARAERTLQPRFEFGLLAGGTVAPQAHWAGGLFLSQSLQADAFSFGISEDVQAPLVLSAPGGAPASYVPLNLGIRFGWTVGETPAVALRIHLGGLGSVLWLMDGPRQQPLEANALLGGATFSADLILQARLVVSLEGRIQGGMTPLQLSMGSAPLFGQILLSLRFMV